MPEFAPVLFVDVLQSKTRWPLKRAQRWHFVLRVEGNFKVLATSENYVNFQDCVDAARLACDNRSRVFLREHGNGLQALRFQSERPQ